MAVSSYVKKVYIPIAISLLVALQLILTAQTSDKNPRVRSQTSPPTQNSSVPARGTDVFLKLAAAAGQGVPARRLVDHVLKTIPNAKNRYWAVVDFNQPSTKKRFYVFDIVENRVDTYYVSHGRGSEGAGDDGIADVFSNEDGSFSSSLGIYRSLGEYTGAHGRSMRLEGLDATNSKALDRAIVLHRADYVSDAFIRQTGRIGRSEGCLAVENSVADDLIDKLQSGAYIVAWKK